MALNIFIYKVYSVYLNYNPQNMTRINIGVPPLNLTDRHLLAEHREIKRMHSVATNWLNTKSKIPDDFRVGLGHVLFFVNKGQYTLNRYNEIYEECIRREFDVENYASNWDKYPKHLMGDYSPTAKDISIIKERIRQRILESTKHRYYKNDISKNDAITLLYI